MITQILNTRKCAPLSDLPPSSASHIVSSMNYGDSYSIRTGYSASNSGRNSARESDVSSTVYSAGIYDDMKSMICSDGTGSGNVRTVYGDSSKTA